MSLLVKVYQVPRWVQVCVRVVVAKGTKVREGVLLSTRISHPLLISARLLPLLPSPCPAHPSVGWVPPGRGSVCR